MTEKIICACLLVVGVIHLIPVSGMISADKLSSLYGLSFDDPSLQILMRHRAVLFGLLGAFIVYAAFVPALQPLAFVAAGISIASFFWLSFSVGGYGPAIHKIVWADVVAAIALMIAILLFYLKTPL